MIWLYSFENKVSLLVLYNTKKIVRNKITVIEQKIIIDYSDETKLQR